MIASTCSPVAERFDPEPQIGWEQLRAERLHEIRWWSLDEVRAATGVWFAPRRLGDLLHDLARNGPPTTRSPPASDARPLFS